MTNMWICVCGPFLRLLLLPAKNWLVKLLRKIYGMRVCCSIGVFLINLKCCKDDLVAILQGIFEKKTILQQFYRISGWIADPKTNPWIENSALQPKRRFLLILRQFRGFRSSESSEKAKVCRFLAVSGKFVGNFSKIWLLTIDFGSRSS